jgi:virginiamycin B lyase
VAVTNVLARAGATGGDAAAPPLLTPTSMAVATPPAPVAIAPAPDVAKPPLELAPTAPGTFEGGAATDAQLPDTAVSDAPVRDAAVPARRRNRGYVVAGLGAVAIAIAVVRFASAGDDPPSQHAPAPAPALDAALPPVPAHDAAVPEVSKCKLTPVPHVAFCKPRAEPQIQEFALHMTQSSGPAGLIDGPDNNMWFALEYEHGTTQWGTGGSIGRITPAGSGHEFPIRAKSGPMGVAVGFDGNIWFYQRSFGWIGHISRDGSGLKELDVGPSTEPNGITRSEYDHNIWFTLSRANEVGWVTRDGKITRIPLPTPQADPADIVTGPDGAMWFAEQDANQIGRVAVGAGAIPVEYKIGKSEHPHGIARGYDGNLWFTSSTSGDIGRMSPCGEVTLFEAGAKSWQITYGDDGNMWFAEHENNAIGRITMDGHVDSFPVKSTGKTNMRTIARGPNRTIWFAETDNDTIGRVEICEDTK